MTQISRPFQIALVAFALFAAVWFVALRGHAPSSTGGSGSTASGSSAPATQAAAAQAKSAAAPTPIYHGAAPGVEGLSRAISKAHGAVATSQQNAHAVEHLSADAPPKSAASGNAGTTATGLKQAAAPTHAAATTSIHTTTATTAAKSAAHTPRTVAQHSEIPAMQAAVERELKQGKVVLLLFWDPKGADDVAVHTELEVLLAAHHEIQRFGHVKLVQRLLKTIGLELNKKIAVHYASASQVASFGSFTRAVQVYQTPTLLIVNRHGVTTTLTGLTDAFSIEQTIDEARHA